MPAPIEQRHDDTSCSYLYQPNTGPGPAAATYGEKQVTLLVTARHAETGRLEYATKSLTYKVFFAHSLDDDADSEPNWFDVSGDDGAVPQLGSRGCRLRSDRQRLRELVIHHTDRCRWASTQAECTTPSRSSSPLRVGCPAGVHSAAQRESIAWPRSSPTNENMKNCGTTGTKMAPGQSALPSIQTIQRRATNPTQKATCCPTLMKSRRPGPIRHEAGHLRPKDAEMPRELQLVW